VGRGCKKIGEENRHFENWGGESDPSPEYIPLDYNNGVTTLTIDSDHIKGI